MNAKIEEFIIKTLGKFAFMCRKAVGHWAFSDEEIEQFINTIRSDERDACAKVCEDSVDAIFEFSDEIVKETARNVCINLAKGIRARGNE